MTGPAGTGKTTTVRVLTKHMGVELVEWGEGVEERTIGSGFGESLLSLRHAFRPDTLARPRVLHVKIGIFPFSSFICASQSLFPEVLVLTGQRF